MRIVYWAPTSKGQRSRHNSKPVVTSLSASSCGFCHNSILGIVKQNIRQATMFRVEGYNIMRIEWREYRLSSSLLACGKLACLFFSFWPYLRDRQSI